MQTLQDLQRQFVLSLIRRDYETDEEVLSRLALLPSGVVDALEGEWATLFGKVLEQARKRRCLTPAGAATILGKSPNEVIALMADVGADTDIYAQKLMDGLRSQTVMRAASSAAEAVKKGEDPAVVAERLVGAIASLSIQGARIVSCEDYPDRWLQWVDQQQARVRTAGATIPFPFKFLDENIARMQPGEIALLTGVTGGGKSSLALYWAQVAALSGVDVTFIHCEDPHEKVFARLILQLAWRIVYAQGGNTSFPLTSAMRQLKPEDIPTYHEITSQVMPPKKREVLNTIVGFGRELGLFRHIKMMHAPGATVENIIAVLTAEEMTRQGSNAHLVILDYLNKLAIPPNILRSLGLYEARARDVEMLKVWAEQYGRNAVILQQVNDAGEAFETRQSMHKAQVHLDLAVDRNTGLVTLEVRKANSGRSGIAFPLKMDHRGFLLLPAQVVRNGGDSK